MYQIKCFVEDFFAIMVGFALGGVASWGALSLAYQDEKLWVCIIGVFFLGSIALLLYREVQRL